MEKDGKDATGFKRANTMAVNKKPLPSARSWNRRESAVVRFAISCRSIADAVENEFQVRGMNIMFSERAIGRVSQIVSQTVEKQYATDLHIFANVNNLKKRRVEDLVRTFDNVPVDEKGYGMITAERVPVIQSTVVEMQNAEDELKEVAGEIEPETKHLHDKIIADFGDQPLALSTSKSLGLDVACHASSKLMDSSVGVANCAIDKTDSFYDDEDIAWVQMSKPCDQPATASIAPLTTIKKNFPEKNVHQTPASPPIIQGEKTPQLLDTPKAVKKPVPPKRSFPVDDSFYNDDDISWANVVTKPPETEKNIVSVKENSPVANTDEMKPPEIAKTPQPTTSTNQPQPPVATSTPQACDAEVHDWFQPDLHSTPLGAPVSDKNETLNLSVLFTPRSSRPTSIQGSQAGAPPPRVKVAGLRRITRKPPT